MAVPKKKISHSRTRTRLLSKPLVLRTYTKCKECQNFIKPHSLCTYCFNTNSYLNRFSRNSLTNLKKSMKTFNTVKLQK